MKKHLLFKALLCLLLSIVGLNSMWAETVVVNATTVTSEDNFVTITCAIGSGSNAPVVQNSSYVRLYASNTIVISSPNKKITAMTLTWSRNSSKAFAKASSNVGVYIDPDTPSGTDQVNGTWSGSANEITFTIGSSGQKQLHSIDITYEGTVVPTHTAHFYVNGSIESTYDCTVAEGANITFPASNPSDINGKTFMGWAEEAISGTTNTAPTFAKNGTMGTSDKNYYAVFATKGNGGANYKMVATLTQGNTYVFASSNTIGSAYALDGSKLGFDSSSTTADGKSITITALDDNKVINNIDSDLEFVYAGSNQFDVVSSTDGAKLLINGNGFAMRTTNYKAYWDTDKGLYGTNSSGSTSYYVYLSGTAFKTSSSTTSRVYAYEKSVATTYSDYCTTVGNTPSKTTPTLTFANPTYNATMGEAFTVPTLNNPQEVTVSYSSSATGVATVNATTGAIELVGAGTTQITASFAGNETYNAASASYDLVVKPVTPVFESLEDLVAADLTSGTEVTVSFENVAIKDFYVTNGGNRNGILFDIQKDGQDIEIYYQNVPVAWVAGGTVNGTLTNCVWKLYSGTWELAPASGWSWSNLNYTAPVILTVPSFTTQPVSATYELNASATNLTVAATGNPAPTYQWYSNTTNSNEDGTALDGETKTTYKPSTATAGTFYYYCVATNSEGSATSDVATITVNEPVVASLPFEFDGGKDDIASKDGMSQTGLSSDYSASPKLKFDSQGDNVIINFNEAAKKVTYTIKGNSTSGTYAFDVMESADGVEYTTVHSHTSITDATSYTDNLASTSRFVKFVYTTKANGNVALGNISIVAASVLDNPELAFAQSTYTFLTNEEMQVVATSVAGSTGAITYALTAGDEDAFLIDENTGEIACYTAGTYTVTATIAAATGFTSGTATCTVKIKEPVVGNSIIIAQTEGGVYAMTTTCNGSFFTHTPIKKVGDKYVVSSLDNILFYTNTVESKTTIQSTSNAQYVQATAAKNISYTDNEYKWTNAEGVLTAATASHGTLQYNTASPRFTTYTSKVGQYATIVDLSNVIVGDGVVNFVANDGEGNYYATFSSDKITAFPTEPSDDVTLYVEAVKVGQLGVISKKDFENDFYCINEDGDKVIIPANTAVLLHAYTTEKKAPSIAYEYTNAESEISEYNPEFNMLVPCTTTGIFKAETDDNFYFKLAYGDNTNKTKLGFWYGAEDGSGNFNVKAGGAVLCVPQTMFPNANGAVKGFSFDMTSEETAITQTLNNAQKTDAIYNLQGVKLQKLQKGINIVNGRKVIR